MQTDEPRNRRSLTAAALFAYFSTGIVLTIIGPCVPALGETFHKSLDSVGLLFTCVFGGNLVAVFVGGIYADVIGEKRVLGAGTALLAAGLALVGATDRWALALAGFLILGAGLGFVDVGTNALVSHVNSRARARSGGSARCAS